MALRSIRIACLTLLAALPLCAVNAQQTEPPAPSPETQQRTVPVAPSLSEMRAMTAEQLDRQGDRLRQAKDYLSARDCYREAIRKHATAAYYNKLAISEILLRHPADAEKAAKKAVRKDKLLAEAWNNLAVSYYMRNMLVEATRTYQRAISLSPNFASFHSNLAAALMDAKDYKRGVAEYRRAFEIDPTFFEHASENGITAHMGSPKDRAQFSFVMARLFAENGNLDRTLHFLRSAMEDGYPGIDEVYRDKEFAQVRNDERFQSLMKERPAAVR